MRLREVKWQFKAKALGGNSAQADFWLSSQGKVWDPRTADYVNEDRPENRQQRSAVLAGTAGGTVSSSNPKLKF